MRRGLDHPEEADPRRIRLFPLFLFEKSTQHHSDSDQPVAVVRVRRLEYADTDSGEG